MDPVRIGAMTGHASHTLRLVALEGSVGQRCELILRDIDPVADDAVVFDVRFPEKLDDLLTAATRLDDIRIRALVLAFLPPDRGFIAAAQDRRQAARVLRLRKRVATGARARAEVERPATVFPTCFAGR